MRALLFRWIAVFLALTLAAPASAHPVPFSYLDVEVQDAAIEGRVRVHLVDLAPVLGLTDPRDLLDPAVRTAHRGRIERYLASRLALDGAGFRRAEWGEAQVLDDGEALQLAFRIAGPPPGALSIDTALFPSDPNHQTFVNVYEGGALRQQFIFTASTKPQTFYRGTTAGALAVMGTFIPAGVEHIL